MKTDDDKNFESFLKQNKPLVSSISSADKSALFSAVLAKARQSKALKTRPNVFLDLAKRPMLSIAASFIAVLGVILFASYSDIELDVFNSQQTQSLSSEETVAEAQTIEFFLVQSFEPWEDSDDFATDTLEFESDYVAYFLE